MEKEIYISVSQQKNSELMNIRLYSVSGVLLAPSGVDVPDQVLKLRETFSESFNGHFTSVTECLYALLYDLKKSEGKTNMTFKVFPKPVVKDNVLLNKIQKQFNCSITIFPLGV